MQIDSKMVGEEGDSLQTHVGKGFTVQDNHNNVEMVFKPKAQPLLTITKNEANWDTNWKQT